MASAEDISAGEWIESGDSRKFVFCVNGVYIYVYTESLIKVNGIDAIVNPTNTSLGHGGGVSKFVANAAGSAVTSECEGYIKDFGHVRVKENFVSTAGKLLFQGIIHAVGPQWSDYSGQLSRCARHLYQTVLNVLTTACLKGWKSVAIPAISSGAAGIPKKLCAEMYVKALIEYPISGQSGIKEIHFVDTNSEIIELVVDTYEQTFDNPSLLAFENAEKYPGPPPKQTTVRQSSNRSRHAVSQHQGNSSGFGPSVQPSHASSKTTHRQAARSNHPQQVAGSKATPYKITYGSLTTLQQVAGSKATPYKITYGSLTTLIYSESITNISGMDCIVNSTIETLQHRCGVARQIADAAGDGVLTECNDHVKKFGKLKVTQNFVSSGGNLSCSGIIHVVGPQWGNYNDDRGSCAADLRLTVVNALKSARKHNWRKLAMTAMSSNHSGVPKDLCAAEYTKAIAEFARNGTGSLVEVHFIDTDKTMLDMVINAHKTSS